MSGSLAFRDQIALLTNWFVSWNRCEQTIALVSLLRRTSWMQARFLRSFIEHVLENAAASLTPDQLQRLQATERSANDVTHLTQLAQALAGEDSSDELRCALRLGATLLDYVLLLDTTNEDTKSAYFKQVANLLARSTRGEPNASLIDTCRQLLSSVLIHPGLTVGERQMVLMWLTQYGQSWERGAQRVGDNCPAPRCTSTGYSCSPSDCCANGDTTVDAACHITSSYLLPSKSPMRQRTAPILNTSPCSEQEATAEAKAIAEAELDALTPVQTDSNGDATSQSTSASIEIAASHGAAAPNESDNKFTRLDKPAWQRQQDDSVAHEREQGLGLEEEETVEGETLKGRALGEATSQASRDIATWLKALRLHKYTHVFDGLGFDELLCMTDELLERKGVTRGARKKILMHIDKLSQRGRMLRELELEIVRANGLGCVLKRTLDTLEQVLATPLRPSCTQSTIDTDSSLSFSSSAPAWNSTIKSPTAEIGEQEKQADAQSNFAKAATLLFSQSVPDDDVVTLITRVLGKIYTQLLLGVSGKIDEVLATRYVCLVDRCCHHSAFAAPHRSLLGYWRAQISEKVPIQRCKPVFVQPFKPTTKQMKCLMGKSTAGGMSNTYSPLLNPVGFQPNVNVPLSTAPYYGAQAQVSATHAAIQHRNSLPMILPTADACPYLPPGGVQQMLAGGSMVQHSQSPATQTNMSGGHLPPWHSWVAASSSVSHSHVHSHSHSFVVQSASPVLTPSSGSAVSSQISLNSADISAALNGVGLPPPQAPPAQPRRASCEVYEPAAAMPTNAAPDMHINDRNNNLGLRSTALGSNQADATPGVAIAAQKRRFERTHSAPNQAALFARLRHSAPVNLCTAFSMNATIREQPSVDQDDASIDCAASHCNNLPGTLPKSHAHCQKRVSASAGSQLLNVAESERELDSLCMRMTEAALDS